MRVYQILVNQRIRPSFSKVAGELEKAIKSRGKVDIEILNQSSICFKHEIIAKGLLFIHWLEKPFSEISVQGAISTSRNEMNELSIRLWG